MNYEVLVQQLYICYYGRPADLGGWDYWTRQLTQTQGDLTQIISAFSNSTESQSLFANSKSLTEQIDLIYQNLLGRSADADGKKFYSEQIQSGKKTLASLSIDVLNGVKNDDALIVNNKLLVSDAFIKQLSKTNAHFFGEPALAIAKTLLSTVTSSPSSVDAAIAKVPAFVNTVAVASDNPSLFEGKIKNGFLTDLSIISTTLTIHGEPVIIPAGPAPDTTAPVFDSAGSTPADNATNVALGSNVTLKFNENIHAGSSDLTKIYLKDVVTDTTVPSVITVVNDTIVINPNANLTDEIAYYVTWDASAIKDAAGNAVAAVADETTFNFTSADVTAPIASVSTATIANTSSVNVQSNEIGTAYLVKNTVTVTDLASITNSGDSNFNSVSIAAANTNTSMSASGLSDGVYKVYTVDAAGNLSSASANSVTIDTTAPSTSVSTTTIPNSSSVNVQSTEVGTAYLVKNTVTVTNLASITGSGDSNFNSVSIAAANTNTSMSASGLSDGVYKVYAVDAAGNLSSASTNSVTVDTTAPVFSSGTSTPSDNSSNVSVTSDITLKFSENLSAANSNLSGVYLKQTSTGQVVSSTISILNDTVVIHPNSQLLAGSESYYATWDAGSIQDAAGNSASAVNDSVTYNFSTVSTYGSAPTVTSIFANAGDVFMWFYFDEAVTLVNQIIDFNKFHLYVNGVEATIGQINTEPTRIGLVRSSLATYSSGNTIDIAIDQGVFRDSDGNYLPVITKIGNPTEFTVF